MRTTIFYLFTIFSFHAKANEIETGVVNYMERINSKLRNYYEEKAKYPESFEVIAGESTSDLSVLIKVEEIWWTPKQDNWSITYREHAAGRLVTCVSGFREQTISCISEAKDAR